MTLWATHRELGKPHRQAEAVGLTFSTESRYIKRSRSEPAPEDAEMGSRAADVTEIVPAIRDNMTDLRSPSPGFANPGVACEDHQPAMA